MLLKNKVIYFIKKSVKSLEANKKLSTFAPALHDRSHDCDLLLCWEKRNRL